MLRAMAVARSLFVFLYKSVWLGRNGKTIKHSTR